MTAGTIRGDINMKTPEEILGRIKQQIEEDDLFMTWSDLLKYLPYSMAKEFLKPEVKENDWKQETLTKENVIASMSSYMVFALGKAEDHRGISACRSIDHFKGWLWLLGDDELIKFADHNYPMYGAPILKKICDKYGLKFSESKEMTLMAEGEPCSPGCHGCGS
jgi:hypothetical protein